MDYDAVIIGAGLGGCAAGCVLAGAGKKILIIEKMDKVGGRFSSDEKDGFKMDLGSHFLLRCEYGPFEAALREVGMPGAVRYRRLRQFMLKHHGVEIKIGAGAGSAEIRRLMSSVFPTELVLASGQMAPMAMGMINGIINQYDNVSIRDFLRQYVEGKELMDLVNLAQLIIFGTPYELTPASEAFRIAFDTVRGLISSIASKEISLGYPEGGLISVPRAMCDGIVKKGGEVRLNTNVRKVVVEDGRAAGVETTEGEVINAPVVISNGGIKETVSDLVGVEHFEKEYSRDVAGLVAGIAPWCLRVALDRQVTDVEIALNVPREGLEEQFRLIWEERKIPDGPPAIMAISPSNLDPALAPEGRQSIIAFGPVAYDTGDPMDKMERLALEALEDLFPGCTSHMMWHDFLTPGTFMTLGEKEAPAIGIALTFNQVGKKRPSSVSPLEGLYYVGGEAGRNFSAIPSEMATRSGMVCAEYILKTALAKD